MRSLSDVDVAREGAVDDCKRERREEREGVEKVVESSKRADKTVVAVMGAVDMVALSG